MRLHNPEYPELTPHIVQAWESAGAFYGHVRWDLDEQANRYGNRIDLSPRKDSHELPGFMFSRKRVSVWRITPEILKSLPVPETPFGLTISGYDYCVVKPGALEQLPRFGASLKELELSASVDSSLSLDVFQELESLETLGFCCNGWSAKHCLSWRGLKSLRTLRLGVMEIGEDEIDLLSSLPRLEHLSIEFYHGLTAESAQRLRQLKHLVRVDIEAGKTTDEALAHLGHLTPLRYLRCHNCHVTDAGIQSIAELPRLEYLEAFKMKLTDIALQAISKSKCLTHLNVMGNAITDRGLKSLSNVTNLKSLNVARTSVGDAGISHLASLRHLRRLDISETCVSDRGMAAVAELSELRELCLPEQISNAGIKHLKSLANLEDLNCYYSKIDDSGLPDIVGLPKLRVLNIQYTGVSDEAFAVLAGMPSLEKLPFDPHKLTDTLLGQMHILRTMKELSLHATKVTNDGLQSLSVCQSLEILDLATTRFSADGLKHLTELPQLKSLWLGGNPYEFDAAIDQILKMKSLRILCVGNPGSWTMAGLKRLAGMESLRLLGVAYLQLTEAQVSVLRLYLPGIEIEDSGDAW